MLRGLTGASCRRLEMEYIRGSRKGAPYVLPSREDQPGSEEEWLVG